MSGTRSELCESPSTLTAGQIRWSVLLRRKQQIACRTQLVWDKIKPGFAHPAILCKRITNTLTFDHWGSNLFQRTYHCPTPTPFLHLAKLGISSTLRSACTLLQTYRFHYAHTILPLKKLEGLLWHSDVISALPSDTLE